MSFHLPPLRERVQDIAPLVRGMAARFNTKFRKDLFDVSPRGAGRAGGVPLAGQHPPAGERRAAGGAGQQRARSCCSSTCRSRSASTARRPANGRRHGQPTTRCCTTAKLIERNVIQRALANNGYSRARAASALGISRVTLYKKMKKYGLMRATARSANP